MDTSSEESQRITIRMATEAFVRFKREFKRELTPSVLAELYVALELDLSPAQLCNNPGFDLLGSDGKRYQVKHRSVETLNVDVNNFDFDFLALVNMGDDYALKGIWLLPVGKARELFVFREKFRKYQATQKAVKANGEVWKLKTLRS
jgi:hypothetical protein